MTDNEAGIRRRARARLAKYQKDLAAAEAALKAALNGIGRARRTLARHRPRPRRALGIDVSNHQGVVDWKAVRKAGYRFAWCKATEGEGFRDATLKANVAGARAAGVKVGAYHFARPRQGRTGDAEADDFVRALHDAGLGKGDLIPVCDIEHTALGHQATLVYTRQFLGAVEEAIGVRPLLYTYPAFLPGWGDGLNARLWVADYGRNDGTRVGRTPRLPAPFKSCVAWQFTSNGRVPGVAGRCDVNWTPDLRRLLW